MPVFCQMRVQLEFAFWGKLVTFSPEWAVWPQREPWNNGRTRHESALKYETQCLSSQTRKFKRMPSTALPYYGVYKRSRLHLIYLMYFPKVPKKKNLDSRSRFRHLCEVNKIHNQSTCFSLRKQFLLQHCHHSPLNCNGCLHFLLHIHM